MDYLSLVNPQAPPSQEELEAWGQGYYLMTSLCIMCVCVLEPIESWNQAWWYDNFNYACRVCGLRHSIGGTIAKHLAWDSSLLKYKLNQHYINCRTCWAQLGCNFPSCMWQEWLIRGQYCKLCQLQQQWWTMLQMVDNFLVGRSSSMTSPHYCCPSTLPVHEENQWWASRILSCRLAQEWCPSNSNPLLL